MAGLPSPGHAVGQMPNHMGDGHVSAAFDGLHMASRTSSGATVGSGSSQVGYDLSQDPGLQRGGSVGVQTSEAFHEKYEIGETLGRGSFAVVKAARNKQTGERFAIKMIDRNNQAFDGEALKKEIRIMQLINHANCIRLHEVYEDTGMICLVLDLVTGGELFDRIIARGYYSEKDAAEVSRDVLQAVAYLHKLGIVHRDLKPENLLYMSNDEGSREYNQIKVADFGLAKCKSPDSLMRTMCGTPGYVAPEVLDPRLAGPYGYGPHVDIWSIGVVVYIMLCGFPPFYSENTVTLFRQIRRGDYAFPSPYWDSISDAAKDLVCKMLVVDPRKRLTAEQCLAHEWITKASLQVDRALGSQHKAFLLIRRLPLFEQVDPECLSEVTARLQRITAKPGSYIINSGEEGKCMYFVGSTPQQTIGSGVHLGEDLARGIQRSKCLSVIVDGHEVTRLGTGDYFGEVALVSRSDHRRTADVITLSTCELYMLSRTDMEAVTQKFPILQARLQSMAEARLKRAQSNNSSHPNAVSQSSTGSNSSFGSGHSHEHAISHEAMTSPPSGGGGGGGAFPQGVDPNQYYMPQQNQPHQHQQNVPVQNHQHPQNFFGQEQPTQQPMFQPPQPVVQTPQQYQPQQPYMGHAQQYQPEQPPVPRQQQQQYQFHPAGQMASQYAPSPSSMPMQPPMQASSPMQPPASASLHAPGMVDASLLLSSSSAAAAGQMPQPLPPQQLPRRARGKRRPQDAPQVMVQEHPVFDHDKAQRHQMLYQRQPSKVFLAAPEAVPRIDGILRMSSKLGVMDSIDQGLLSTDWLGPEVSTQYAGTTVAGNRQMLRPPPLQAQQFGDGQAGMPPQQPPGAGSAGSVGGSSGSLSDPSPRVISHFTSGNARPHPEQGGPLLLRGTGAEYGDGGQGNVMGYGGESPAHGGGAVQTGTHRAGVEGGLEWGSEKNAAVRLAHRTCSDSPRAGRSGRAKSRSPERERDYPGPTRNAPQKFSGRRAENSKFKKRASPGNSPFLAVPVGGEPSRIEGGLTGQMDGVMMGGGMDGGMDGGMVGGGMEAGMGQMGVGDAGMGMEPAAAYGEGGMTAGMVYNEMLHDGGGEMAMGGQIAGMDGGGGMGGMDGGMYHQPGTGDMGGYAHRPPMPMSGERQDSLPQGTVQGGSGMVGGGYSDGMGAQAYMGVGMIAGGAGMVAGGYCEHVAAGGGMGAPMMNLGGMVPMEDPSSYDSGQHGM